MEVNGLGSVRNLSFYKPLRPVNESRPADPSGPASSALSPQDTVEISAAGKAAASQAGSSLRAERLAQIKAAIEDGSYDTPERLEAALDRMFAQHGLWDE